MAWLKQSPTTTSGLSGQWERAREALRRDRPFVDTSDPPKGLDAERFDKNITDELRDDGHWPPAYTEAKLETELIALNETTAGALSSFIEASCRAGRSEAEIKDRLTRIASELSSPAPKPDLR